MKDYGKALKILRKRAGLTQAQLAEKLNVTYQTVSKWENGINSPDISVMENICELLSVPVDEYLRLASDDTETFDSYPRETEREACVPDGNTILAPSVAPVKKTKSYAVYIILAAVLGGLVTLATVLVPVIALAVMGGRTSGGNRPSDTACTVYVYSGAFGSGTGYEIYLKKGEDLVFPENTFEPKKGYMFTGWECDGKMYQAGESMSVGSQTVLFIFAHFEDAVYTVVYEYGGQSFTETYKNRPFEAYYTSERTFSRVGYKQTGWKCGTETYSLGGAAFLESFDSLEIRFEPVWTPIEYNIEINFGQNSVEFDGERYYGALAFKGRYGEDPLAGKMCSHDALVFNGWTVYDANGNVYDGDLRYITSEERSTIRVEANWISGEYTLILRDCNDNFEEKRIPLSGDEEYTLPLFETLIDPDTLGAMSGAHYAGWKFYGYPAMISDRRFADGETVSDLMTTGYDNFGEITVTLEAYLEYDAYAVGHDGSGGDGNEDRGALPACDISIDYDRMIRRRLGAAAL